jgi:hypothetical protein
VFPVAVLTLSESGFYCEGVGLEDVEPALTLSCILESGGPAWSPRQSDRPWRSGMPPEVVGVFDAAAELLYLDLSIRADVDSGPVGLGARFASMTDSARAMLAAFLEREVIRHREWRTRGGAVPAPPRAPSQANGTSA